jgi:hypothetical protein
MPSRRKAGSTSNESPCTRRVALPKAPAKAIHPRATPRASAGKAEDRCVVLDFLDRDVDRACGPLGAGKALGRERLFELPADRGRAVLD